MKRYDNRKLISIYTEFRPVSSVAMIGAGIVAMFVDEAPLGVAVILNGIVFGILSSPPYSVKTKVVSLHKRNLYQRWMR